MVVRILPADDPAWNESLKVFQQGDIYFTAEYHKSFETSMQRQAQAFVYETSEDTFFFPFMLGEITQVGKEKPKQKCFDIETVYGYSGPLATSQNGEFLKTAHLEFKKHCVANNIICQMQRFHPLLQNEKFETEKVIFNRNTIGLALNTKEALWTGYHPKLRNDIVRAGKLGLELIEFPAAEFAKMYEATMRRIGAGEFYIFASSHFDYLQKSARVFAIKENDAVLATAVFLLHKPFIHYHLAASSESPNQAYASKLLIHKIAEWAIDNGYENFHLGGGRTAAADDSLLFFKKRFGGKVCDFYIGKTIFNQELYDEICGQWRRQGGVAPGGFLQPYRLPL